MSEERRCRQRRARRRKPERPGGAADICCALARPGRPGCQRGQVFLGLCAPGAGRAGAGLGQDAGCPGAAWELQIGQIGAGGKNKNPSGARGGERVGFELSAVVLSPGWGVWGGLLREGSAPPVSPGASLGCNGGEHVAPAPVLKVPGWEVGKVALKVPTRCSDDT